MFRLTYFQAARTIIVTGREIPTAKILFAHRWRLTNDRIENFVRLPGASNKCPVRKFCSPVSGRGYSFRRCKMLIQEGYVYHINDSYFAKAVHGKP